MKYDDVTWHWEGNYPKNLSKNNAYNHIAVLLNWAIIRNLLNETYVQSLDPQILKALQDILKRKIMARNFLIKYCDGCLLSEFFTDEANEFLQVYYEKYYLDDFFGTYNDNYYGVANNWDVYDRITILLDDRFAEWKAIGFFKGKINKQENLSLLKKLIKWRF